MPTLEHNKYSKTDFMSLPWRRTPTPHNRRSCMNLSFSNIINHTKLYYLPFTCGVTLWSGWVCLNEGQLSSLWKVSWVLNTFWHISSVRSGDWGGRAPPAANWSPRGQEVRAKLMTCPDKISLRLLSCTNPRQETEKSVLPRWSSYLDGKTI